jgi:hypothetical protein
MSGIILDAQLHKIARTVIEATSKNGSTVKVETRKIHEDYMLVSDQHYHEFEHDVAAMVAFEQSRQLNVSSLRPLGYARYRLQSELDKIGGKSADEPLLT